MLLPQLSKKPTSPPWVKSPQPKHTASQHVRGGGINDNSKGSGETTRSGGINDSNKSSGETTHSGGLIISDPSKGSGETTLMV